jgi:hypothetical protein
MPASSTLYTDAKALAAATPNAATLAKAASGTLVVVGGIQGGAPVDIYGMFQIYLDSVKTLQLLLTNLEAVIDATDTTILTYVQNDLLTLGT